VRHAQDEDSAVQPGSMMKDCRTPDCKYYAALTCHLQPCSSLFMHVQPCMQAQGVSACFLLACCYCFTAGSNTIQHKGSS
jgi:hypothetical protein